MLIKLILAGILIYLLWIALSRIKSVPQKRQKQMLLRGLFFAVLALLILGALTGRAHWLGALFAALIPLLRFGLGTAFKLLPFWMNRGGVIPFRTPYLDVKIQLRSGRISGLIRRGEFSGRPLESLNAEEFHRLIAACEREDSKAAYLLRYLRKTQDRGQGQNQNHAQPPPPNFGDPAIDEALQILGLKGSPSKEEIIAAHKRLIHKLHPDRGGSDFLAARVNQARDVLLKHQGH